MPVATCEGKTDYPYHRFFFFGLLFLFRQLTAPKSQVWPELDSSLYQLTQHPTSLMHPARRGPHGLSFSFISLYTGFILEVCLRPNASPWLPLYSSCLLSQTHTPQTFSRCRSSSIIVFFFSVLFSISFFPPPPTERYRRVCVAFVAQLTAIQKPLLACHHCDVVRRRCTRTNSVMPAFRKSMLIRR